VDVDLEMEVAADRDRVAGLPHEPDRLAGVDALAAVDQSRSWHVGVEVGAALVFPVDQEVVAVEDWVVAGAQDLAVANCDQGRAAGGDYVEALVGAAAVSWGAEFTDWAAGAVGALDGEDVAVVGGGAVAIENPCGRSGGRKGEEEER
jgi:hypothetical protein